MAARLVPALAGVLACYALFLLYDASRPAPFSPNQRVASWLTAHHLRYGLASYWEANSVTIDSGGHVRVVPVRTAGATLVITHWNSVASWYDPRLHDARFVIFKALQGMPVANRSSRGVRTASSRLPGGELPGAGLAHELVAGAVRFQATGQLEHPCWGAARAGRRAG